MNPGPGDPGRDLAAENLELREEIEGARGFRSLFENSVLGLYRTTPDGRILLANPAMVRLLGYGSFPELAQHNLEQDSYGPSYARSQFRRRMEEEGGVQGLETTWQCRDGATRYFRESALCVRGVDGAVLYYEGTLEDVTARRIQDLELQRLNRLYNLLSQLGQALVTMPTREDLLREFCAIAVRTGGFPLVWVAWVDPQQALAVPVAKAGEHIGYLDGATFATDERPEGQGPLGRCLRENRSVVCQDLAAEPAMAPWRIRAEAHGLRALSALPIHLEGRPVGAFMVYAGEPGVFRQPEVALLERAASELSFGLERFASEREKARLQEQLIQSQKLDSLGSLAGGVAHDFNNMLGGIMGYSELLLDGETQPARRKYLQAILAAATRSAELTRKLLAFGRRGRNLTEAVDLEAMVKDCLLMLRPSIPANLQVVVDLDGCPSIDGDPSQIHQVLMNLCINAMEAMPERGTLMLSARLRALTVATHPDLLLPDGPYLELTVSDTGLGMTSEVRQRIFEPFYTTKNSSGLTGTGLGLSTAYGIVHAHGGTITVQSARGKGSTFRVFLPVGRLAPARSAPPASPGPGKGLVLLVEDEPLLRDLGASVLESLGYEVVLAADGVEAVAAYGRLHPRLRAVLLDLKMPRMGGREAFLAMRGLDTQVPVIVCTGYGDNEEVQELLSQGAFGMLAKPYQISALAEKLGQAATLRETRS